MPILRSFMIKKICTNCLEEKFATAFYKRGDNRSDELRSHCRACCNRKSADNNKKYYIQANIKARNKRISDREGAMWKGAKGRSIKKNLAFNISKEDIIIPEFCPILGIKLSYQIGTPNGNSPSLDRIDNNKGYIKGNVKVISRRANMIKGDASISDLEAIKKYMVDHGLS